ncbi:hypothetical protein SJI00_21065 [Pseudomonas sp. RP23018S]|uniref:hypothetical protein n=1 Tax=Pseudomonas sp. RP23018S TaxID=3096037 RepID=UPI002ACADD27|nr:hypothetical protein [Pseudomonas sp. RP23018S]MDZ5605268.1 hypothetical protein [Pseudomonas sp. RP23018S]
MNDEGLKKTLLITTMIRNGALCVISIVALVCTLYIIFSPADELSAVRGTGGGIPVIDLSETHSTDS